VKLTSHKTSFKFEANDLLIDATFECKSIIIMKSISPCFFPSALLMIFKASMLSAKITTRAATSWYFRGAISQFPPGWEPDSNPTKLGTDVYILNTASCCLFEVNWQFSTSL